MSPDDECAICFNKRENHGDYRHKFSEHGELEEKPPAPLPKKLPPRERGKTNGPDVEAAFLRLLTVLSKKNLIDGVDLIFILGGGDAADRGYTEEEAEGADPS